MKIQILNNTKIRKVASYVLIGLIVVAVIGGSYWLGFTKGTKETRNITVEGVVNPQKEGIDFSVFWEAWNILKSRYVSEEKANDNQNLLYGSIAGLLSSLGDPNTCR